MTHDKTSLPPPRCATPTLKASDRDRADVPLDPLSQANSSHLPSAIPACSRYVGAFLFLASRCGRRNTLSSHVDAKCWEQTLNKPIALTTASTPSAATDWLPLHSAFPSRQACRRTAAPCLAPLLASCTIPGERSDERKLSPGQHRKLLACLCVSEIACFGLTCCHFSDDTGAARRCLGLLKIRNTYDQAEEPYLAVVRWMSQRFQIVSTHQSYLNQST